MVGSAIETAAAINGGAAARLSQVEGIGRMAAALTDGAGALRVPIQVAGCVTVADVPAEPSAPGSKLPGLVSTPPGWLLNGTAS